MSLPPWTHGGHSWDPGPGSSQEFTLPGGGRPSGTVVQSQGRRSPTRRERTSVTRKQEGSSEGSESKYLRLGRTQGLFGVGAWAARAEICTLLESGTPAEDVIRAITAGEEATRQLESFPSCFLGTGSATPPQGKVPEEIPVLRTEPANRSDRRSKTMDDPVAPMTAPKAFHVYWIVELQEASRTASPTEEAPREGRSR